MSESVLDTYEEDDGWETEAAEWVERVLLLEEEHQPLPENPSPGMLVARVSERLCQATMSVHRWECQDEEGEDDERATLEAAAVYLYGAAGLAITAISHIALHLFDGTPTEFKDELLHKLDEHALEVCQGESEFLDERSPAELVQFCFALLTGAYQGIAALEGMDAFPVDPEDDWEEDEEVPTINDVLSDVEDMWPELLKAEADDPDDSDDDIKVAIAESLYQAASLAATVADSLIEREESERAAVR